MFDVTHLVVCFAAVFCFACLVKGSPVETVSIKAPVATCETCRKACSCGATTPAGCTCQERLQPDGNSTRDVRSAPTSENAHRILKRQRRCGLTTQWLGATRNFGNEEPPPAPANRNLREDIRRRLAEIRTRIDAIRSLAFLGYRRAAVVGRPLPVEELTSGIDAVDVTADRNSTGADDNRL